MIFAQTMESLRRGCGHRFPRLGGLAFNTFFRLMPETVETELLPGVKARLDLRDLTARATYWQGGRFEHPTPDILAAWGQAGAEMFFDIGSNYGFFSYWMWSQCPALQIHAFEPNPRTFERLNGIVQRNALSRIHPHQLALADVPGTLQLTPGKEDSGHSTLGTHPQLTNQEVVDVQVHTFDGWCQATGLILPPKPSWVVKMDVEGFELKALQGMQTALRARAFAGLAIEINDFTLEFCGTSAKEVIGFLRNNGYQSIADTPAGSRWPLAQTANNFFVPISR